MDQRTESSAAVGGGSAPLNLSLQGLYNGLSEDKRLEAFSMVLAEETKRKALEEETKHKALEEETKRRIEEEETKRRIEEEETKRKAKSDEEETKRKAKSDEEETKRVLGFKEFELEAKRMRMETLGSVTATSQVKKLKSANRWNEEVPAFEDLKTKFTTRWGAQAATKREEIKTHLQGLKALETEASIQVRFGEVLELFSLSNRRRKVLDTSKTDYLCGLEPDYTLLDVEDEVGELTVQAMFELKAKKTAFTSAHLGRAWTNARLQLECQLWRTTAKVALVGPEGIGVLRATRKVGESPFLDAVVFVNEMVNFDNDNAVYLLDDFLHQEFFSPIFPRTFVKFPSSDGDSLDCQVHLAEVVQLSATQNGTVFKFPTTTKEMRILKVVAEDNLFATELNILRKLHERKVLSVSNLVGFNNSMENFGSTKSLLFDYHGVPLTKLRIEALNVCLVKTVDILKDVHGCRILHRDVRPANILARPDPSSPIGYDVRLIDFGLAVESETSFTGEYVGTFAYSPQDHLEKLSRQDSVHDFEYNRATDLESLVKAWIMLALRDELRRAVLVLSEDSPRGNAGRLLNWWSKQLELRRDCYEAAKRADYEGLKQSFEAKCPWIC